MAKKKINKKKQKRAFTLIELLAVIVILAIIALIAVPIVMNLLNKSRQKSAENSAYSYLKATEYYIGLSELELEPKRLEAGKCYNINDSTIINEEATEKLNNLVDIKGSRPTGLEDHLCFDEKYTVKEGILTINGYTIEIKNGQVVNSVKGAKINIVDFNLDVSETSIERGSEFQIIASFEPKDTTNQKLSYKSSDERVVTVDSEGLVKGVSNGEAIITVTSEDNNKIKKEVKITVITSITGLSLKVVNDGENKVIVGNELQLEAILEPSDTTTRALTWKSDNETVARVDENGRVFGRSIGTATITATAKNGVTGTIEITVNEVLAESITISGDTEMAKGQSMTLAATINPSDTTNKTVTWSSSDTSVATIDENGNVTSVNGGTATITATTSNGKTATFNITVNSYLKVVYLDPTNLTKTCTKADVNTSSLAKNGCMKWYAYQDTGSNYKMLLDHAVFERIDMEDYSSYLSSLTSSYGWKVIPTSIDASYLAGTVNRTTSNYEGSRPAAFESWLKGFDYWTGTYAGTVDGDSAYWQVYADGYMYIIWMWDQASIRPVITISKDNVNVK